MLAWSPMLKFNLSKIRPGVDDIFQFEYVEKKGSLGGRVAGWLVTDEYNSTLRPYFDPFGIGRSFLQAKCGKNNPRNSGHFVPL
jgi:hypothetical protein